MKKLFAPFEVVKINWMYLLWLVFLLFGILDIWQGIFSCNKLQIINSIKNGTLSTFSISICIPFFTNFLLSWVLDKKEKKSVSQFVQYKAGALIIDIIWIMIVIGLWLGNGKGSIVIQIIIAVLSLFYSFYMYCIECMSNHYSVFKKYDDEYLSQQKERMDKTVEKASETNKIGEISL